MKPSEHYLKRAQEYDEAAARAEARNDSPFIAATNRMLANQTRSLARHAEIFLDDEYTVAAEAADE